MELKKVFQADIESMGCKVFNPVTNKIFAEKYSTTEEEIEELKKMHLIVERTYHGTMDGSNFIATSNKIFSEGDKVKVEYSLLPTNARSIKGVTPHFWILDSCVKHTKLPYIYIETEGDNKVKFGDKVILKEGWILRHFGYLSAARKLYNGKVFRSRVTSASIAWDPETYKEEDGWQMGAIHLLAIISPNKKNCTFASMETYRTIENYWGSVFASAVSDYVKINIESHEKNRVPASNPEYSYLSPKLFAGDWVIVPPSEDLDRLVEETKLVQENFISDFWKG